MRKQGKRSWRPSWEVKPSGEFVALGAGERNPFDACTHVLNVSDACTGRRERHNELAVAMRFSPRNSSAGATLFSDGSED